jgi:parvulin-like peptidyl-prolyl isomerase
MQRRSFILALVLFALPLARAGEVLDRLVATVNGHALLQSDVDEELSYECFVSNRSLQDLTTSDRSAALDRLIDQELLQEQMQAADFRPVKQDEVDKALESLKADYSKKGTSESWASALTNYGITEGTVRRHIETELNQLHLIELRLRPSVQIDSEAIKTYYREQLLPKLPPGQHISLEQATPTIREVLVQQKMNEALESWLQALRSQAQIQRLPGVNGDQTQ